MKNLLQREAIGSGVSFSSIHDPKFKHNRISINMVMPLEKEAIAKRAIVPYILRQGTRTYPDFTLLNERLSDLYGASLEAFVDKFGSYQLLCLAIVGIDNRFAFENEDMVEEMSQLLADVLLDPNLEDGIFSGKDTRLEKEYLQDLIESEINDKRTYAVLKCKSVMCAGEPTALRKYGTKEEVAAVTAEQASEAYREILDRSQIEIMMCGSGNPETARKVFAERFGRMERHPIEAKMEASSISDVPEQKNESETMDVRQGKLVMGFRLPMGKTPEERNAERMAVALLGGTPTSLLFMNVREKMSLCYYCVSRILDPVSGVMMIDSGVEAENVEKARTAILQQVDRLKSGDFEERNIKETQLLLRTAFRSAGDSLSSLENWYLTQILLQTNRSPEDELAVCNTITKDQLVAAAQKIKLDTVYTLLPNQE